MFPQQKNGPLHQNSPEPKNFDSAESVSTLSGKPWDYESTDGATYVRGPITHIQNAAQSVRPQITSPEQAKTGTEPKNQFNKDNVDKLVNECRQILRSINIEMITEWHKQVQCDPDDIVLDLTDNIFNILKDVLAQSPIDDLWQITIQLRTYELKTGNETKYKKPNKNNTEDQNRTRYMDLIVEGINHYIHKQGLAYIKTQDPARLTGWIYYDDNDLRPLNVAKKILQIQNAT